MRLFIAEKPSLGRAIAENLGKVLRKMAALNAAVDRTS